MVLHVAAFGSTADCGCEPGWFHNADCPFPFHCGRIVQNLFTRCTGPVGRSANGNAPTATGACLHWKRDPQWSRQQWMITESSVLFQGFAGLCTGRTLWIANQNQGTVRTVAESAEKRRGRTAIRGIEARSIPAGASRISRIPVESAALSTPQRDLTLVLKIPRTAALQSGCNTAAGSFSASEGWL
jgi:hypothetical protein